jgi:hypothetical protein
MAARGRKGQEGKFEPLWVAPMEIIGLKSGAHPVRRRVSI